MKEEIQTIVLVKDPDSEETLTLSFNVVDLEDREDDRNSLWVLQNI